MINMSKNTPNKRNRPGYLVVACVIASILLGLYIISIKTGEYINIIDQQSQKLQPYQDLYKLLSGLNGKQKTLLVLANNAELRTGGGFIGTVGIIDSVDGKVKSDALTGVYGIDSSKNCEQSVKYIQPDYLKNLSPCPSLRDSNNHLDFAGNAMQSLYFYQLNTSQSVDNVVQITPRVLERLLDKTGPVYLKEYDITVTKDNFRDTVQLEVEAGRDKQQKKDPKSGILGSLANQMISRLIAQDIYQLKDYIPLLQELIDQKHINLYSKNDNTQKLITKIGADGELKNTDDNYFMMTESNFSANKSSAYIKNRVNMNQALEKDGRSIISVGIVSTHSSDYRIPYVDPNSNQSTWLVGENNSRVNIVIPEDSTIIYSSLTDSDYKVTNSNGRKIIEYDRYLKPLTSTTVEFKYKIPTNYIYGDKLVINSLIQKQLGGWPYEINYSLTIPNTSYQLVAANVDLVKKELQSPTTIHYSGNIDSDEILSFMYKK